MGESEFMLKLSLLIIGFCQWCRSLKCDFVNSDIFGRCGCKGWCGPTRLSLDGRLWRSWRHLRLLATPSLSLVGPEAAPSMAPVLNNRTPCHTLAAVPSRPFIVLLWCVSWVSVDSGSVSSALFDGNSCSFVLCPISSRAPPCHLCEPPHSDVRWWHRSSLLVVLAHCLILHTKQNTAQMNYGILQY